MPPTSTIMLRVLLLMTLLGVLRHVHAAVDTVEQSTMPSAGGSGAYYASVRASLVVRTDASDRDVLPGVVLHGYKLVERTALLGVCNHVGDLRPRSLGTGDDSSDRGVMVVALRDDKKQVATTGGAVGGGAMVEVAAVADAQGGAVVSMSLPQPTGGRSEESDALLVPEGPSLEYQCLLEDPELVYVNSNYRLKKKFAAGSHGEVWRATRRRTDDATQHEAFILKRLFVEKAELMVEMGLREAHFGRLLADEPHVTRFVEYFFRDSDAPSSSTGDARRDDATASPPSTNASPPLPQTPQQPRPMQELWLVFYDEGISLRHYLYATRDSAHSAVLFEPSPFWHKLRKDAHGEDVLREIVRQLLEGTAALHDRGITHRDIKPSNVLVHLQRPVEETDHSHQKLSPPIVKLADFGSAVDEHTLRHLYGDVGPTQAEETREYQPPEVLFSEFGVPYDVVNPLAYDLWSIGVVFLEMVLGSPEVFTISPRARAKMDAKLRNKDEATKRKSYLLHVLTQEFCIFRQSPYELQKLWNQYALAGDGCHFGRFNSTIIERDPMRAGLRNPWGLDLMWKLLQWHPSQRITARAALDHAFFKGPYVCSETGRTFATKSELKIHEAYLAIQRARDEEMAFVVREKYDLPTGFVCPQCQRQFSTITSCERHLVARKHSAAAGTSLCDHDHSSLQQAIYHETEKFAGSLRIKSLADTVAVALLQGKKKYMEDCVVVHRDEKRRLAVYAVIDGHLGTGAAEYVRSHLVDTFTSRLKAFEEDAHDVDSEDREASERVIMRQLFLELHEGFVASTQQRDGERDFDFSGCTLSLVVYFESEQRLLAANVGDSRAILVIGDRHFPLSQDHWPNVESEQRRIESSGGFITFEGLWRVVGQLAVSRSIGDRHLRQYVTAEPSVFSLSLKDVLPADGRASLVIASDGVWDTMENEDVVQFVQDTRQRSKDLASVAADLLQEAFLRGSLDNLAVLLVNLHDPEKTQ